MECLIIKLTCPVILNNDKIKYEDLYSEDTTKQREIAKLLEIAIRKREEIIDNNAEN